MFVDIKRYRSPTTMLQFLSNSCVLYTTTGIHMGHAPETGTSGHLTCFLLRKALKMLYS